MGAKRLSTPSLYAHCVCSKYNSPGTLRDGEYCFAEKGKRVCCTPKQGEQVTAIQIDGCLLTDNHLKCDGAFIWEGKNKAALLLVELKGAGDIPHAFKQLAYVKHQRPEYIALKQAISTKPIIEKAFIVSNGVLSKPEKEKLENTHNIRVAAVLHSEPTKTAPELRNYL